VFKTNTLNALLAAVSTAMWDDPAAMHGSGEGGFKFM